MFEALKALDARLQTPLTLLIGGGGAMLLAHGISLITQDIDGLPLSADITPAELDTLVKAVAKDLGLSPHWYNDYFNTFTYSLPADFKKRLIPAYRGRHLTAMALGKEDLLIMKCFAGREKDIGHARALIRKGTDTHFVEAHLEKLVVKKLPGVTEALRFLHDILDSEEVK